MPERIKRKEFDLIVYAQPSRTSAWIDEVAAAYPPSQVAFLSGTDSAEDISSMSRYSEKGTFFVRELYDDFNIDNKRACSNAPGIADAQGLDCCAMEDGGAKIVWSTKYEETAKWKPCGNENDVCKCSTEIRFGNQEKQQWSILDMHGKEASVKCNNVNSDGPFPDPAVGSAKLCQCRA
eukprot:TRINITY_DN12972_c0_g1_i1.p1 TRINITY_DN12972_c0_g1~~TRINITY_DN12972_c0_g1_i1.p1  ORF type:complete len:197 (+),score=33.37 TRINITY_DN12972_c0_g1_i1:57-593(+)